MRLALFVFAFVLVAATNGANAQGVSQQQQDWCTNKGGTVSMDLQVSGCTAAIQSGRWSGKNLAWAFINRGNAYFKIKDYDRAFADYSEAMRLDPTSGP